MANEYVLEHRIGAELHTRGPDAAIAALAERQHGVVARWQLFALGLSRREIGTRLQCGRLHLLHRGVYAVGHRALTQRGRWMAAVLAAGPGAVLSHRSAAALWGIRPTASARIEIIVPKQLRPRPGLLPHCAVLPPDERTTRDGIPVTTAARTLLDLAGVLKPNELDRALNEAEILRLPGPQALIARYPGHRGTANLRTLLLNARRSLRSPLEAEFLEFLDAKRIERPETNVFIEGYEIDVVYREAKLIIELDGYRTHGTRAAFERDRLRDRRLSAKGWRTIRVTDLQLGRPAELAQELLSSIRA
jgi:very-short-patch-repair endonuclease